MMQTNHNLRGRYFEALRTARLPELSPADSTSKIERSLPSLTEAIEFLEWIERSHPLIQRIAVRFYSWVKRIDQRHLRQIANSHFNLVGGGQ